MSAGGAAARRRVRGAVLSAAAVMAAGTVGCALPGEPAGVGADVRGAWEFTGTQAAPSATLEGQLTISAQDGDLIAGTAGWDERDAVGVVRPAAGPISGRVIGDSDVDFDVTIGGVTRRHVGRLLADTMSGNWVQVSDGRSGSFRAVRGAP